MAVLVRRRTGYDYSQGYSRLPASVSRGLSQTGTAPYARIDIGVGRVVHVYRARRGKLALACGGVRVRWATR